LFGLLGELVLCLVLGWVILGLDVTNLALFLNLVLVGLCMLLRSWASDGYFPSQASSPCLHGYLEKVALCSSPSTHTSLFEAFQPLA
jgi:hypothetical protein